MDFYTALLITAVTVLLLLIACYKASTEIKLLLSILTAGVYVYSGLGIASYTVDNTYMYYYFVFLVVLLLIIRSICSTNIRFVYGYDMNNRSHTNSLAARLEEKLEGMHRTFAVFTALFFASYLFNMVYPTNRLLTMFNFSNFTSYGIHARRIEHNTYILLKIADTIGVSTLPFFFIYLYECATGKTKNKVKGLCLVLFWVVLSYGKYNYLSRYELVVYLGFIIMYCLVCKYKRIVINKRTVLIVVLSSILLVPFLVNFIDMRLGRGIERNIGFFESLSTLIKTECFYPEYYDVCVSNAGLVDPLQYILWIVCLPIPSALWSGKPVVQIAYIFTGIFTNNAVTAANYSNLLPSVLGEAFLIFGKFFFWIEAVILGIVIGVYFKYFLRTKTLSLLTAYMLLMLATIGRGGSQSYLGVIINGSIVLILWVYISRYIRFGRRPKNRKEGSEQ